MSEMFRTTKVPAGTTLFYSSARLRELQIDEIMRGVSPTIFPTDHNIFLAPSNKIASGYTNTIVNIKQYYHHMDTEGKTYLKRNFNVTHVYETIRDVLVYNFIDQTNVETLLFGDPQSPFHYSNAGIKAHNAADAYNILNSSASRKGVKQLMDKYGLNFVDVKYSGFILLLAATGYHNLGKLGKLQRNSSIFIDFTIIQLLTDYLHEKGITDIVGWYQEPSDRFHEEYAFFDPADVLKPVPHHPKSWTRDVPRLRLRTKYNFNIIDGWIQKERQNIERTIMEYRGYADDIKKNGQDSEYYEEFSYEDDEELDVDETIANINAQIANEEAKLESVAERAKELSSAVLNQYLKAQFPGMFPRRGKTTSGIQRVINRRTTSCRYGACHNATSFEACQSDLETLVKEMRLYENKKSLHHVGVSVADHSIWVTRAIHQWLLYADHPWTGDIHPELHTITLLSALMHDVGKIGDHDHVTLLKEGEKYDHPVRGYMYLDGQLDFHGEIMTTLADIPAACSTGENGLTIIKMVALLHHHLGELLLSVRHYEPRHINEDLRDAKLPYLLTSATANRIYSKIYGGDTRFGRVIGSMNGFKYIIFCYDFLRHMRLERSAIYNDRNYMRQVLLILLAVSAADVYGAHPVTKPSDSIYEEGLSHLLDPQVIHQDTSVHPDIRVRAVMRPYYKYLYYTFGLVERDNMIAYFDTIENYDNFVDAWDGVRDLCAFMEGKKQRVPTIFHYLDASSPEVWLNELMRLLKSGALGSKIGGPPPVPIVKYLMSEATREDLGSDGIVGRFRVHVHPSLTRQAPEMGIVPVANSRPRLASI